MNIFGIDNVQAAKVKSDTSFYSVLYQYMTVFNKNINSLDETFIVFYYNSGFNF
jgi:hypothetical protein